MKKQTTDPNLTCPANPEHTLRVAQDIVTNEIILWCPSPACTEVLNKGVQARTLEDAVKALRAKHTV